MPDPVADRKRDHSPCVRRVSFRDLFGIIVSLLGGAETPEPLLVVVVCGCLMVGLHVLAYLGNNRWIEADPGEGRVIEVGPTEMNENPWFQQAVVFVRWRWLSLS